MYCAGNDEDAPFSRTGAGRDAAALYDSPFIHIGGDECPKGSGKKMPEMPGPSKACENGLKDENELQSWINPAIFANQISGEKGRARDLDRWDEILEGGLARGGSSVMSWRGVKGRQATRGGDGATVVDVAPSCTLLGLRRKPSPWTSTATAYSPRSDQFLRAHPSRSTRLRAFPRTNRNM
jgi:hexosaminidase